MPPRRPRYLLAELVLVVVFCGLFAGLVVRLARPLHGSFAGFLGLEVAFLAWVIAWKAVRGRRTGPECRDCGRRFVRPRKSEGPPICPRCRRRSITPDRLRRTRRRDLRTFFVGVFVLAFACAVCYSGEIAGRLGVSPWVAVPLAAAGLALGFLAALVLGVADLVAARARLMRSERHALARARRAAGGEGRLERVGPMLLWSSDEDGPAPPLAETMEDVRRRFEARLGEPVEARRPLRAFVFARREGLVAFHRQAYSDLWNLDALYAGGAAPTITMSAEVIPHRFTDLDRAARLLFGFYFLESYKRFTVAPWLQQGVANALARSGDDLARLNRKMLASLERGTALGSELFRIGPTEAFRLLGDWGGHRGFARFAQLNAQSWSLVEYLWGDDAPPDRRDRFRELLRSLAPKEPAESAIERCFRCGAEDVLGGWREWVRRRGIGVHEEPPGPVAEALAGRLVPLVQDRGGRPMDRILAIRDMGRLGYARGADALIDLLGDPGDVPTEEVVWALEAISGRALGDDGPAWRAWLAGQTGGAAEVDASPPQGASLGDGHLGGESD